MSDNKNNSSGFFWGVVIGTALGSLVSTKKGRKIIKDLSEHGLESLENIINIDDIKEKMSENEIVQEVKQSFEEKEKHEEPPKTKKPKLFRGVNKK